MITRHDQRQRYKKDFNEEYGDYRNLHESIAKVSAKFTNLEQTLNKAEKGSEDYEVSSYGETRLGKENIQSIWTGKR